MPKRRRRFAFFDAKRLLLWKYYVNKYCKYIILYIFLSASLSASSQRKSTSSMPSSARFAAPVHARMRARQPSTPKRSTKVVFPSSLSEPIGFPRSSSLAVTSSTSSRIWNASPICAAYSRAAAKSGSAASATLSRQISMPSKRDRLSSSRRTTMTRI